MAQALCGVCGLHCMLWLAGSGGCASTHRGCVLGLSCILTCPKLMPLIAPKSVACGLNARAIRQAQCNRQRRLLNAAGWLAANGLSKS